MPGIQLTPAAPVPGRIRPMDWLRGLSVVFMIECHSMIFLDHKYDFTPFWMWLENLNGLVCVAFLFTAGFAQGLVGSRASKDAAARRRRAKRTTYRLAQVLLMSLYFHTASAPVYTQPATLLRVDILFCIAIGVACTWGIVTICRGKNPLAIVVLLLAALTVLILTPDASRYRGGTIVTELLNGSNGSMFPLFPWLMYPLLGAAMGVTAALPQRGPRRLLYAIIALLLVSWTINQPIFDGVFWSHFRVDDGQFWVRNALERIWKLSFLLITLFAIDYGAIAFARVAWMKLFTPIERTVDFFSRHALFAYLVHLSLLYGFLRYQYTNQWHGRSTWAQFAWRMPLVILGTAVVCMAIHRVKRLLEWVIRNAVNSRSLPDASLAPKEGLISTSDVRN